MAYFFIHGITNMPPVEKHRILIAQQIKKTTDDTLVFNWSNHFYPEPSNGQPDSDLSAEGPMRGTDGYRPALSETQKEFLENARLAPLEDFQGHQQRGPIDDIYYAISRPFLDIVHHQIDGYLSNVCDCRTKILAELHSSISTLRKRRITIMAHSFGSVIALDYLYSTQPEHPISLVTMGSPLGWGSIRAGLRKLNARDTLQYPNGLHAFFNISVKGDIVCMASPSIARLFPQQQEELIFDCMVSRKALDPFKNHVSANYLQSPQLSRIISILEHRSE